MNIDTPYRIMIDLIQGILCESNGHAGGATKIYNEIVKPLQEAAKAAALLRQQGEESEPPTYQEIRKMAIEYSEGWGQNNDAVAFIAGYEAAMKALTPSK
jgi:hypothetical protein